MAKKPKTDKLTDDQQIVKQAHQRMERCIAWEGEFQKRFVEDLKFANADPDNKWQWPQEIQVVRVGALQPMLTINKTRQHNLSIINDAKQNKPGVKITATGGTASYDSAQVYMGVVRKIEYKSSAEHIYDQTTKFQVEGGIGYFRVTTDYVSDSSFDQEIFIKGINDPMSVFLDPDIEMIDGSDARFGFIFNDMPKDEFDYEYPDFKDHVGTSPLGTLATYWLTKDHIRVAEYFRRVPVDDKLVFMVDPQTKKQSTVKASQIPKKLLAMVMEDRKTKTRDITSYKIEWYKIAGDTIIDRKDWAGKYIPIVRVVGEETKIEGKLDRKGHTRSMKDVQRMYNYWSSAGVEFIALQGKTPWITVAESIEGYETFWSTANTVNHAYLPWNAFTEDGATIPPPFKPQPPVAAQAYVQGMQIAQNEMMMVTGQYQAQMGENENAKSGIAINARQRQGERATYHYIDGLGIGIQFLGKILIDLIPKIYDTERVIKIMGEDGTESNVTIDPEAKAALTEKKDDKAEGKASLIFNPNVGEYEVQADVGPSYATKRQDAFNAFVQLASQDKNFMNIAGDIMFKAADFPMADELAKRYRRMIPLQALGEEPPPEIKMMLANAEGKMQSMQAMIVQMTKSLAEKDLMLNNKTVENALKGYQARTQRFGVVANAQPELANRVLPVAAQTEAEILAEGGAATMGDQFEMPHDDPGGMPMEIVPMILAGLANLAQGQQTLQTILMAPKTRKIQTDAKGKPIGSVETVDLK